MATYSGTAAAPVSSPYDTLALYNQNQASALANQQALQNLQQQKQLFGPQYQAATAGANLASNKTAQEASQEPQAFNDIQSAIGQLQGLYGTLSGAPSASSSFSASTPTLTMPDTSAANAASYAAAKDQAGQTSGAALRSLQNVMAGRGLSGSNLEADQARQIIQNTAQGINDVSRTQAINNTQLAQQAAELQYQGGITQRGQDIQQQEAANQLQVQKQQLAQQALLGLIGQLGQFSIAY